MSKFSSVKQASKDLTELQTFDPNVFKESEIFSKDFCGLMLCLSLLSNDLKDLIIFSVLINDDQPREPVKANPELGQFNGLNAHVDRQIVSIIRELKELIRSNSEVIQSREFGGLVQQLPKLNRNCWLDLVDTIVLGKNNANASDIQTMIERIRSETGIHYDSKELLRGYRLSFIEEDYEPYISRGVSMAQGRFYFADASAVNYAVDIQKEYDCDFSQEYKKILENINMTITLLVDKFINKRSGWRQPKKMLPAKISN